jgi:ferredoxin
MLHPFKPTNWASYLWLVVNWRKMNDLLAKASNLPVIGDWVPLLIGHQEQSYDLTYVPINQRLEENPSTVAPLDLVKQLVRKSAHRVIVYECACRQGWGCQEYPHDLGCIYLGDATKDVDPSLAKHATVEETLEHIDRGVAVGLVPTVGQVDIDALWLGCNPKSHFATICLCCDCCCFVRRYGTVWSPQITSLWHKLEGLSIQITDECTGCGGCVEKCFVGAISLDDGKAHINQRLCKGCGVCVEQCPVKAISIEVTDGERMEKAFFERIESRVDIVSTIPNKKVNNTEREQIPHPRHGTAKVKYKHSRE